MKYFLDSVKKQDIENWIDIVEGVTSNPILLKQEGLDNYSFLNMISDMQISNKKIFIQIKDIDEFKILKKLHTNFICKVTVHPFFYPLIRDLKASGLQVAATTIYDIIQINQAIEMGCDYTMVYIHKNEYPNLASDAYKLKQMTGSNIKLIGASFRGKHEVQEAILAGMNYCTAGADVLGKTFQNAQLQADFDQLYA